MENLSDAEFFSKVAQFLDDAPPEALLHEIQVLKRIQDCLMSMEPTQNLQALTILRAFARKLTVRVKLLNDNRVKWQGTPDTYQLFKTKIEKAVVGFADLTASLFKKKEFLPLALVTCKELLNVTRSAPTDDIVEYAMQHINNPQLRIPVLEIIANSNTTVEDLPLYDARVALEYPILHQQLMNISPKEQRENAEKIKKLYSTIQKINKGEANVDRDLLQWCDFDLCYGRIGNNIFASHPNEQVRINFYEKAKSDNIDVLTFIDPLLRFNQFDKAVADIARELILKNIDTILSKTLTIAELISLQCLPLKNGSHILKAITDYLNKSDEYTKLCGWVRFLYSKESWLRALAKEQLTEALKFEIKFDIMSSCPVDTMLSDFRTRQKLNGAKGDPSIIQGLVDTLFNETQQTFVKDASAKRLINQYLNPLNSIKRYTDKLSTLPFKEYASLLHAVSIRDYNYVVTDADKLVELLKAMNEDNKRDLLPILSRSVFTPLTKSESNGASFLRLPNFMESVFEVPGSVGFYDMQFYQLTNEVRFSYVIEQWTSYKIEHVKPIQAGFNLHQLTQLSIADKRLAADCLMQLDSDESAREALIKAGSPGSIIFFLCMASLSARMSNRTICKMCDFLLPSAVEIGLKLAQSLTEFGGECEMPDGITEMIMNEKTRRAALSFICARINFKQSIDGIDFERVFELLKEKQPINVTRQLMIILSTFDRSKLAPKFIQQKDFSIKCLALHISPLNKDIIDVAQQLVFSETEATAVRVACMELLSEYYRDHEVPSLSFLPLFRSQKGESISTFFLLRLLAIPKIREQLDIYNDFILPFLSPKCSPRFVLAALYTLPRYEFDDVRIVHALEDLINIDQYTNTVLHLMTTFSDNTLRSFTSEMMFYITDTFANFDASLALINVNRMILIGIEFPEESVPHLMDLYRRVVEQSINSRELRLVLMQVFTQSMSCKAVALKKGFLDISLIELMNADDAQYYEVLKLVACFIYDFNKGQSKLLEKWGIKTLHTIFESHPVVLNFFLSFVKNNEQTQQCFDDVCPKGNANQIVEQKSLLDLLLEAIDTTKKSSTLSLLLELFSNILNGRAIRNKIFLNTKLIPHYVTLVQKYATERKVAPLEGWLRVFIMLSLHPDGMEKLYEYTRVTELLLFFFKSCDEIRTNKIFLIFLRNLIRDKKRWRSLKANIIRECEDSHDEYLVKVFEMLVKAAKETMSKPQAD